MAFVWPKMIQAEVVSSHPVMHAHLNLPRINGDLLSLIPKPTKLFAKSTTDLEYSVKKCFYFAET